MIEFTAEVIEIKAKKTASLDKEFRVVFITENPDVLQLNEAISNYVVRVKIDREK